MSRPTFVPAHIMRHIDRVASAYLAQKKVRGRLDAAPHSTNRRAGDLPAVVVGDIFVASWGYEQTNVDFYQVTGTTSSQMQLRPIAKKTYKQKSDMSRTVVPESNKFTGPAIRKKITSDGRGGPAAKITNYSWAKKWNGKPMLETSYG